MSDRVLIGRIDCESWDGDEAVMMIYRLDDRVSVVTSVRGDGDAEVALSADQIKALLNLLTDNETEE